MYPDIRFSIRTKLFCGIVVPAALLVVVIYLDFVNLSALGRTAETILAKNYKSIKAAYQMSHLLRSRQRFMTRALGGELPPHTPSAPDEPRRLAELLEVCRKNITESGESEVIANMAALVPRYQALEDSLDQAVTAGRPWPRDEYHALADVHDRLADQLDRLIATNERAMERADTETRELAARARGYSVTLLLVAMALVLVFSLLISRHISRPLVNLARGLAEVGRRGGEYPGFPVTTRDEIGFLTTEFNRLLERLRVYDQSNREILNAERAKVRAAERAKGRFVADLSHQLKTPLTSLAMSVGMLATRAREELNPKHLRLLDIAQDDCTRLTALANELVDVARLEAMVTPKPKESLDLGDVLEKCLKPLSMQAEEKGVMLRLEVQDDLPPVSLDSFRFPWVITNLVGNALRYTPRGGRITLSARRRADSVMFTCRDTGSGIDPAFLPHVFDRYTQFSQRQAMGTIGLGLAIVKEIIEEHGGDIAVSSQPGQGTTFDFWIPMGEGAAA